MTSGTRLLALATLIGLSMWLGYLLGKGSADTRGEYAQASQDSTEPSNVASSAAAPPVTPTAPEPSAPPSADQRATALNDRIDYLAAQTDDRVVARERTTLLADLARELTGADANRFAPTLRYYNNSIPRDGTGLMLESSYYQKIGQRREAIDLLIAAAEFPETNEQLQHIERLQAELVDTLFEEHAAIEDWSGLTDYFETLLVRAPNNDRIRLYLANAQAQGGSVERAIETLDITGTEAGVTQSEIDELRDSLLRSEVEPIRFRAQGNSLVANATLNSSPIELLVDTGATKTAMATSVLRRLGAYPLNETAQVMTAAGRITAQLYQVPELVVEDTLFRDTIVIALDRPPANWDGLLGMDLLRDMNVDLSDQLDTR